MNTSILHVSIIKQFNAITFFKAVLCGCIDKSIFSGFIPTMQFIEKQHHLTFNTFILLFELAV